MAMLVITRWYFPGEWCFKSLDVTEVFFVPSSFRSGKSTTVDHSPHAKTCDSAQSNEVGSGEMMARTGENMDIVATLDLILSGHCFCRGLTDIMGMFVGLTVTINREIAMGKWLTDDQWDSPSIWLFENDVLAPNYGYITLW